MSRFERGAILGGMVRPRGSSLYLEAAHPARVAELLDRGADPNYETENGETPLSYCAHGGHLASAELLLAGGADPNHVDPDLGWTPLFFASFAGHVPMVNLLLDAGADPLVAPRHTALSTALDQRRFEVAEVLLDRAPRIAARGAVDPVAIARDRGDEALAERIARLRVGGPSAGLTAAIRVVAKAEIVVDLCNVGDAPLSVPLDAPLAFSWIVETDDGPVEAAFGRAEILSRIGFVRLAPGDCHAMRVSHRRSAEERDFDGLDLLTVAFRFDAPRVHLRGTFEVAETPGAPADAWRGAIELPSRAIDRDAR